jgi:tetratricopeptide (TPR) repeat protein
LGAAHRVSLGYFFGSNQLEVSSSKKNLFPTASPGLAGQNGSAAPGVTNRSEGRLNPAAPVPASQNGSTSTGASDLNKGALNPTTPAAIPGQSFPPLPPANTVFFPSQVPGTTTSANSTPSFSQPQAANPSEAKDSLVVQFDLPDNPAPSGAELEKQGKYREALGAYLDAVKQNPQDAASWWALGNLYRQFHQKAYAVQCFDEVLKLQPANQKLADWLEQYKESQP